MAVDEAIMRAHVGGKCLPTLRLYGWERPAVSLGYFQKLDEDNLDLAYCHEAGISLVRRLTGGRAVLHGHDLTFSIVVRDNELPDDRRGLLKSHRWLVGGVVAALRNMGLDARLGMAGRSTGIMQSADCFAHAAACDVVVGKRKVAGAAQVRKSGVILEQGSMPFRRPAVEPARLFRSQYEESQ
nr:lipoate--protein ligase family protein [Burkholderiales bacterium]